MFLTTWRKRQMTVLSVKQMNDLAAKSDVVAVIGIGVFKPFRREHFDLLSGAKIHESFVGLEGKKVKVVIFPNEAARNKIADYIPKEKIHVFDRGVLVPGTNVPAFAASM